MLSNNDQIGISEEYNIIGKRLFYANWDRDFKLTKQQVTKLGEKYLPCLKDYYKKYDFGLSETEINDAIKHIQSLTPELHKYVDQDRESNWWLIYDFYTIVEIKISDKDGRLKDCRPRLISE